MTGDEDIGDNFSDFNNCCFSGFVLHDMETIPIDDVENLLFNENVDVEAEINNQTENSWQAENKMLCEDTLEKKLERKENRMKFENILRDPKYPSLPPLPGMSFDESDDEIFPFSTFVPKSKVDLTFNELNKIDFMPFPNGISVDKSVPAYEKCTSRHFASNHNYTTPPSIGKEVSVTTFSGYLNNSSLNKPGLHFSDSIFKVENNPDLPPYVYDSLPPFVCEPPLLQKNLLDFFGLSDRHPWEDLTGIPPYKREYEYEDDYNSEYIKPYDVCPSPPRPTLASFYHDHPYFAREEEDAKEHSKSLESYSETVNTYSVKENSSEAPAKITIRINPSVTLPEEPVKRRGRPKRKVTQIQQSTVSLPPAKRSKRSAGPVAKGTRKGKKQNSKPRSKNNPKQMSHDKREQHNKAERDRRLTLKTNLNLLEDKIPEYVLLHTQAAITHVKKALGEERENKLSHKVKSRLEFVFKNKINATNSIKRKKGARFSKVVVLQSAIFYKRLLKTQLKSVQHKISAFNKKNNHVEAEKRLKVQNLFPTGK